jgi:hypothetical protein
MMIGRDFHTRYQQIAMLDEATGELTERRLDHQTGEAEAFYRNLQGPVRVGIEATGPIRWLERLLAEQMAPRLSADKQAGLLSTGFEPRVVVPVVITYLQGIW